MAPRQEPLDLTGISEELLQEVHGARDSYAAEASQLKVRARSYTLLVQTVKVCLGRSAQRLSESLEQLSLQDLGINISAAHIGARALLAQACSVIIGL